MASFEHRARRMTGECISWIIALLLALELVLRVPAGHARGCELSVFDAQKVLTKLGYKPGPVDGLWGRKTEAAVEQFQKDNQPLKVTGKLDETTGERLCRLVRGAADPPIFKEKGPVEPQPAKVWLPKGRDLVPAAEEGRQAKVQPDPVKNKIEAAPHDPISLPNTKLESESAVVAEPPEPTESTKEEAIRPKTSTTAGRITVELSTTVFSDVLDGGGQGPEMVALPKGCLPKGRSKGADGRKRCVKAFAIGRTEISFKEYDAFARANGHNLPEDQGWGRGARPVINVSYLDASAYVNWLSEKTGKTYRLPSETEWEYAARAHSKYPYPWGQWWDKKEAVCRDCGSIWDFKSSAPVASFPSNAWGLYDMAGNVWEWTCSEFRAKLSLMDLHIDPEEPDLRSCPAPGKTKVLRSVRGGSWFNLPEQLHFDSRTGHPSDYRFKTLGFRVLRVPSSAEEKR